ncbi:hypothetical protein [Reyranella sp.]|uniref:hypothetical protein n=1 Tax=Reyranella sp. TaxID=1929291 RepID=UPI0040369C7B
MKRREFSKPVRAEIVHRATNERGRLCCEGCGLVLGRKPWHIDHTIPEALFLDKSRPLIADDGKLLGWDCCHKPKTKIDKGCIAKNVRRSHKDRGIRDRSTFPKPPPGYRYSWKVGRVIKEAT